MHDVRRAPRRRSLLLAECCGCVQLYLLANTSFRSVRRRSIISPCLWMKVPKYRYYSHIAVPVLVGKGFIDRGEYEYESASRPAVQLQLLAS
jgi:hypothetical protein